VIWQNPWAWLGLIALAVPILIHLLGRRSAKIRKFPTLRFLGVSRLLATRRTRLSDLPLLAVRMGILAAAVGALAAPLLLTAGRERDRARSLARAIIVDTSASMRRAARPGTSLEEAKRLAADAGTSVIVQTDAPASALAGAVGWLGTQRGRREVVVISDFQVGAVDSVDLAVVPRDIGVGLTRIEVAAPSAPIEVTTRQGSADVVARIVTDSERTNVEWTLRASPAVSAAGDSLVMLAGAAERARASAARAAALTISTSVPAANRPIAIVFREYEGRASLTRDAKPLSIAWQGDIVARLRGDAMLAAAASSAEIDDTVAAPVDDPSVFVVVARTSAGRPVALASTGSIAGSNRLLLFSLADAGSLASAALIAASTRASSEVTDVSELEPATVPEQQLAAWRRPASAEPTAARAADGASDGRWLWLVALLLLGAETWMRRSRRETHAREVAHERAA
jgi:hypothetical protein